MNRFYFGLGFIALLILFIQYNDSNSTEDHDLTHGADDSTFYLGGVQVNEASQENWVNTLKEIGMNTVEVTNYGEQWMWNTDYIEFKDNFDGQINEIRLAKEKGLNVVVILRVQLQHWYKENRFLWHGMIMPENDSLLLSWFQKYTDFNLKWAKICQEEGVDVMVIGSEMNALASTVPIAEIPPLYAYYNNKSIFDFREKRLLTYQEMLQEKRLAVPGYNFDKNGENWLKDFINARVDAHHYWSQKITFGHNENRIEKMNRRRALIKKQWIGLIKKVRAVYQGKLSYAANYDNYQEVDFWEHLDFIGINAYFPLREPTDELPPEDELIENFEQNWEAIFSKITKFQEEKKIINKPIMFTELGYTYYPNCTVESWNGTGFALLGWGWNEKLVIWEEQKKCYEERYWAIEALRNVVQSNHINLQGILYWKLTTHDYLIKEESFALHIQEPPTDSLQNSLVKFLK